MIDFLLDWEGFYYITLVWFEIALYMIFLCYYPCSSLAKHLESANTMFSFIWWIIGFYRVSVGGQDLARDSPQLYWYLFVLSISQIETLFVIESYTGWYDVECRLCIIFLGFDVFFVVFCVALACVIGIAVCCCLPCIIALLYAVADQVALLYYFPCICFLFHRTECSISLTYLCCMNSEQQ